MIQKLIITGIVVFLLSLSASTVVGDIVNWPEFNDDWTPVTVGGEYWSDPTDDVNPANADILGSSTVPGMLWAYADNGTPFRTDDELMFRLRVGKGSQNGQAYPGNLGQFVWQIYIDSDNVHGTIEWSLQLDNSGENRVELVAVSGGPTFGALTYSSTPEWFESIIGFSRLVDPTGDGEHLGDGTADAFLDIGIPWAGIRRCARFTSRQNPSGLACHPRRAMLMRPRIFPAICHLRIMYRHHFRIRYIRPNRRLCY